MIIGGRARQPEGKKPRIQLSSLSKISSRYLRSWIFDAAMVVWTALFYPIMIFLMCVGRPTHLIRSASRTWARGILRLLRLTVGLAHAEHGRHNIPTRPSLIVANHQSAWETIAFLVLVPEVAIVAKHELLRIPVMGWFLKHSPMIVIDRAGGTASVRQMIAEARSAIESGRHVLIFPEGTRQSASSPIEFKRGIELLYGQLRVPVVPVALDSGQYWGATGQPKRKGEIRVRYLPSISPGLAGRVFSERVQDAVRNALLNSDHDREVRDRPGVPGARKQTVTWDHP